MTLLRSVCFLLLWAVSAFAVLQLNRLEMGHTICGPWGCGAPTSALLAVHSFWLVTVLLVGLFASQMLSGWNWRLIGVAIASLAAITSLAIGIWDFFSWRPNPLDPEGMYLWQRFLFRLATLGDVPVIQIGITGLLLAVVSQKRGHISGATELESNPAASPE